MEDLAPRENLEGSSMERKLRRNLEQQQEHYARQRKLFEDLRSVSPCSRQAESEDEEENSSPVEQNGERGEPVSKSTRFKLELDEVDAKRRPAPSTDDSDRALGGGETARAAIQRVKEQALADYKRRIAVYQKQHYGRGCEHTAKPASSRHPHRQHEFLAELEQQEASNDALRRQLELLRRLQVDNNRFRAENRSLREKNEALSEGLDVRGREMRLLREEVTSKNARITQAQADLATAVQTSKKLKSATKQLASARNDTERLDEALQDALRASEEAETKRSEQTTELSDEIKRLKRANKQFKQREGSLHNEIDAYRSSIEELEQAMSDVKTRYQDLKREKNKIAAQLADKSAQFEGVEVTASERIHDLQQSIVELQRSLEVENEHRVKAENECEALETQVEQFEEALRERDANNQQLEDELEEAKLKLQERRRGYRDHVAALEDKLELAFSKQKSDAETITNLRRQCEAAESQISKQEAQMSATLEQVQKEARGLRRSLDSMRKYVDMAATAITTTIEEDVDNAAIASNTRELDPPLPQGRRETESDGEDEQQTMTGNVHSEYKVARAASSALRNGIMNAVSELQRARHIVHQQAQKLATMRTQMQELEKNVGEAVAKAHHERDKRKVAEQGREIALQEKAEVLKWGEKSTRKAEELEEKLRRCEATFVSWRRKLSKALRANRENFNSDTTDSNGNDDVISSTLPLIDRHIEGLIAVSDELQNVCNSQNQELRDIEVAKQNMSQNFDSQLEEAKRTLAEVESLHARNVEEVKLHLEKRIDDVENEKQDLVQTLNAANQQIQEILSNKSTLEQELAALEADVPVLAAVAHLFAATIRPLIQQVSDLTVQKRLLRRENADFALQFEQIKCVGSVLKEMLPAPSIQSDNSTTGFSRGRFRAMFRRVVIAVFAANRLQHFAAALSRCGDIGSRFTRTEFGIAVPLIPSTTSAPELRSRGWQSSLESSTPVIKVLSLRETIEKLPLHTLVERLRCLNLTELVASVVETDDKTPPSKKAHRREKPESNIGGMLLQVLSAMDANANDLLIENVSGTFHCRALLERRRRPSSRRSANSTRSSQRLAFNDETTRQRDAEEGDLPVVELIQQRIITLGKRVEDLHFQRNSLQKDNYDLQYQMEQQALVLSEMEELTERANGLQTELADLKQHSEQRHEGLQAECEKKQLMVVDKDRELADIQQRIASLEEELVRSKDRCDALMTDKESLEREIERLLQVGAEEEAKTDRTRADVRRQEEEMRQLKQSVKRAHDLYQRAQTQLEAEVMEKASLRASIVQLETKCEMLERDLREEKRQLVEKSFDFGELDTDIGKKPARRQSPKRPAVTFEDLTIPRRAQHIAVEEKSFGGDDDDSGSDCDISGKVSDARMPRHAASNEQFMREWRQLDVSTAFADISMPNGSTSKGKERKDENSEPPSPEAPSWLVQSASTTKSTSPSSLRRPSSRAELVRRAPEKRGAEIDKVNAAVHDYMDRINEKLSKMYGVPKSVVGRPQKSPRKSKQEHSDAADSDSDGVPDRDIRRQVYG